MGDGQVNCVAILDAIPDGELNTARRLRENLIDLSISTAEGLQVRYVRVNTLADLEPVFLVLLTRQDTRT